MSGGPEAPMEPRRKFGLWLAAVRVLAAAAAAVDLAVFRSSVPAACLALGASIPLDRRGLPLHLLGLPAAALGAWSIHGTGVGEATGTQIALFVLPLLTALLGTLRGETPLYRVP